MIMLGTSIMIIGAILQASAATLPHFIVGRIITGIGNGGNTSTVSGEADRRVHLRHSLIALRCKQIPTWQSETSKSHNRGKLVMMEGALITCGIMISYWVDLGFSFAPGSVAWRFPLAFQIVFCIFILAFIPFMPDSPRWLVLNKREDEARQVLAALNDVDSIDPTINTELSVIRETVIEMSKGSFRDLFTMDKDRNLHRMILGYTSQLFQQITGINLITYYAAVIYSGLGMSSFMSRLLAALNGTEYFLASWPAVFLVERVGRRKLMLFGGVGQAVTMAILAGVNSRTDTSYQIAGIVFLFVFNTFFACGWLGIPWLYPAEIVPLRIRAPANALSTSANWIFNFMVVMVTPVAFNSIGYKTYIVFAAINAFIVPCVYFFYPETAYRSLEEMDAIFHKVDGWKGVFTVVHQAKVEPRWFDKHGNALKSIEKGTEPRNEVDSNGKNSEEKVEERVENTPADGKW